MLILMAVPFANYRLALYRKKRETERRQEQPRRRKRTSAKTRRNRARALQMHLRDVIFLGIAGMIVVVSCINFLQKQALNTSYRNQVATQEAKLADLKERNDALPMKVH